MHLPLVERLHPAPGAIQSFLRFCQRPQCLFLDSARPDRELGRYSFLASDPFETLRLSINDLGAFDQLAARLARWQCDTVPGLPPFQGGAAGFFSYDLNRQLERIPQPKFDEFQVPAMGIGFYDVVLAFDHVTEEAWFFSHGFPEVDPERRARRAAARLVEFKEILSAPPWRDPSSVAKIHSLPAASLAPQYSVNGPAGLTSNFSPDAYLAMVAQALELIYAGDIFQVNLAQRLLCAVRDDSVAFYLRLRERNPATFAAYMDLGDFQIASASPERFLQVREGQVEARPIKGTRSRSQRPEADLFSADELRESEKDRAENVMIVDLLRNDLSRVCTPDSVTVRSLCRLESYEYVQHLVSIVTGQLPTNVTPLELLRNAFPGGSITGAPKVRAMEIIAELEPTARGPYCGCLGYVGFDGSMDTNILIRTITAGRGWWQAPVGGGIVAQSLPDQEYAETWHKAEGLLRAFDA